MYGVRKRIAAGLTLSAWVILLAVRCTAQPGPATEQAPTALPRAAEPGEGMGLTIVYDNNACPAEAMDSRLRTAWGFACWFERGDTSVLFDTGGDASILLANMEFLGLDPQDVDVVVLSHIHGDHTGGLAGLIAAGARPVAYVPVSFPAQFKSQLREWVTVHEVGQPQEILPGVHTTGEMGTSIREQGLVVETDQGLVVITGCAHPGIVEMVRQAQAVLDGEIRLVVGGFHLGGASAGRIREVSAALQQLGVQRLAPCHCTGAQAMRIFAVEFGDNYVQCGVGRVIELMP